MQIYHVYSLVNLYTCCFVSVMDDLSVITKISVLSYSEFKGLCFGRLSFFFICFPDKEDYLLIHHIFLTEIT